MNNKLAKSSNDFDDLAKRLRMQRFDKSEIIKMKNEAVVSEKLRNRRKRAAVLLQKNFRAFIARRKFKNVINELNTKVVVEYLNSKRIERIRANAKQIIRQNLDIYVQRKRQHKRNLLRHYFHFLTNIIIRVFRGHRLRKKFSPVLKLFRGKKQVISKWVNSFKIRLILRATKFQDTLVEIANIKSCLNKLEKESAPRDDESQIEPDFQKRLGKLESAFLTEFFQQKANGKWVYLAKTESHWFTRYISLVQNKQVKPPKESGTGNLNRTFSSEVVNSKLVANTLRDVSVNFDKMSVNQGQTQSEPVNEYDNRPIKPNSKKNYDLSKLPELEEEVNADKEGESEKKPPKKVKKASAGLKRKKPKYDAKKAIEEEKSKNEKKEANKDREGFRKFLKSIKNENPSEEKEISAKAEPGNKGGKNRNPNSEKLLEGEGSLSGGAPANQQPPKKEEENTRSRKIGITEVTMRKKLHELERSPPPKLDIKNVKSKIDCWGEPEPLNLKKYKHDDFSPNRRQEYFTKLLDDIDYISENFSYESYMNEKAETMKSSPYVPYIKKHSFYTKHYSTEIYEQLLEQLKKQYHELKN